MKVLKLNKRNIKEGVKESVVLIKQGKVIICPTDTVYGLLCDATNKKAVNKIRLIKKRPKSKPIPVFVRDIKMARTLVKIDKEQEKFLMKVWPGKVTAVLESKKGRGMIGIRIPKHKFVLDLIKKANRPLAETSVNISGQLPVNSVKNMVKLFQNKKNRPDLILDAGVLIKAKSSKVIDLTRNFRVLRK